MKKELNSGSSKEDTKKKKTHTNTTNQEQVGEERNGKFKKFDGKGCFLCGRDFDYEKDWDSENDVYRIVEAKHISGYVHRKCRGLMTKNMIERPVEKRFFDRNFNLI